MSNPTDRPENDGTEGALALIRRGLDCLEGNHELKPCQHGHWGILACPHCGYIAPENMCECGYPDVVACYENQQTNGVHLKKTGGE